MGRKYLISIEVVILIIIITVTNHKISFVRIPDVEEMLEFQFNLFTISSVLAGFSFTVLGLLTGLFSDKLEEKLKNTSIITGKSRKIVNSIIWFGISAIISLFYIIGIVDFINMLNEDSYVREILFVSEIICIFVGLIYFLEATKGVYVLIEKIYGYNVIEVQRKKKRFEEEMKKVNKEKES